LQEFPPIQPLETIADEVVVPVPLEEEVRRDDLDEALREDLKVAAIELSKGATFHH
jgi:hypothetical protein